MSKENKLSVQIAGTLTEIIEWKNKALSTLEFDKPQPKEYTIEDIPVLEKEIAIFVSTSNKNKDERLVFTRQLDAFSSDLMLIEKGYKKYADDLKAKLLPLKIEEEKIKAAKIKRAQDLVDFKIKCEFDLNRQLADVQKWIAEEITKIYKDVLNSDMDADTVVNAFTEGITEETFQCKYPESVVDSDKEKIIQTVYSIWKPDTFVKMFTNDLTKALSNLEEDRLDLEKAEALRNAVEEATKQEADVELEINDSFSENLNVVRIDEALEVKTKNLKKIEVLEAWSPSTVLKVFIKNAAIAPHYYKGKNFNDVFEPMIKILENMKNAGAGDLKELTFTEKSVL